MALTMTRTRTQTALTQLVETLANLKGELAFVEAWLAEPGAPGGVDWASGRSDDNFAAV